MSSLETLKVAIAHLERRLAEIDSTNPWVFDIKIQLEIRQARLAQLTK